VEDADQKVNLPIWVISENLWLLFLLPISRARPLPHLQIDVVD